MESLTIKIAFTNTAPTATTDTVYDSVTKHPVPVAANGYTTGGYTATITGSAETGGVYTFACTAVAVCTATTGGIGPFRYVIAYVNSGTLPLIGYWDYASSITLASGETFTITPTTSLFTITTT
jgi:hypothetical protein